ncbi:MAG TPA: hypothetical protein VFA38_10515 [Nitrospirales bacterium]|nr:hypothetical protein [Nitrospirales bacterium]
MECDRCHGLMVQDVFEDYLDDTGRSTFTGWRCVLCGAIVDPVICSHRLTAPPPFIGTARRRWTVRSRSGAV